MESGGIRILELKKTITTNNDRAADLLRDKLLDEGTLLVNIMSSPGAGKTSLLLRTIEALSHKLDIGVIEADIDSDVDARTIENAGVPVVQVHTDGMCHLDAGMTERAIDELAEAADRHLDLIFLENVGNLVCPAEFDTGAHVNACLLSVPEGDDKPLKYPLMFQVCEVVLINKIDAVCCFDFDLARCRNNIALRNRDAIVFPVSARTGEGISEWTRWIGRKAHFDRLPYALTASSTVSTPLAT